MVRSPTEGLLCLPLPASPVGSVALGVGKQLAGQITFIFTFFFEIEIDTILSETNMALIFQ
jgi:hypothetical protein